jgi:type IV pilus assembly protein PilF
VSEQWGLAESSLSKYERVAKITPDYLWLAYEVAKGQGDLEAARDYGEMMVSVFPESELTKRYLVQRDSLQNRVVRTVKSSPVNEVESQQADAQVEKQKQGEKAEQSTTSEAELDDAGEQSQRVEPNDDEQTTTSTSPSDNEQKQNIELSEQSDKFHVVKEGENLYRISLLHNIKMATLLKWNNLENTGAIIAGQTLWLVPPNMQEE